MDGILLVDKPKGWTSHDVVGKVRSVLRNQTGNARSRVKVGHAGTLDPMATGLLVVLVGKATKLQDRYMKLDKWYQAEITLGSTSSTDDAEGLITGRKERRTPAEEEVMVVIDKFLGEIEQVPPQHSAIKVDGRRAYELARKGIKAEVKPRKVEIYEVRDVKYSYPKLSFGVHVSSGTYIRSLARDLGETLKTGGYLSSLRRTKIGKLDVADAFLISSDLERTGVDAKELLSSIDKLDNL